LNEETVVCNAGPLIALAGVAQLPLLRALYRRILVPEPVVEEIVRSGAGRGGAIEIGSAHWLEVVPPPAEPDALLAAELGTGESAVLRVAARLRAPLVLIDERRARRIATQVYGLKVRGTAGVLVEAKRAGLVPTIRPLLEAMLQHGYYLSSHLVETACNAVDE
jgi:uncharacterized protein